ncbi:winged helix-turn-helix domain-containing protein [Micrococcoides hystricis]|uniref:Winged helix-turn-helix domain-containing protein n=1 Tax=Micrococcoides hystricis TaxID=1572761 RepID=A0ABV6PAV1_9MICC
MSVSPGYNHISVRNAQKRAAQAKQLRPEYARRMEYGVGPYALRQEEEPATIVAPTGAPGPQAVSQDTVARGFVIYVGLDEESAASHQLTLSRLAAQVRREIQSLAPSAKTHAAVALAPASAKGDDLDVVRVVLGDPTANRGARVEQAPVQTAQHSGVLIDLSRREVQLDSEVLNLTFKEFELLNYMVENADKTVSRDELLNTLWRNSDEVPNERTIDVHIRRLRSKLGRLSNTVRTVRGQGYRFYEHPEVVVWAAPEYTI